MRGLLNITFTTTLIVVSSLAALFMTEMSVTSKTVLAQVPPLPSLPGRGDSITDNQLPDLGDQAEPIQSTVPTNIPTPTIQITSHEDGNEVPAGELTIRGTSSDNEESNCQVYADVNDITPLQNATAAGPRGDDDYSQWIFTYTQGYQLITVGSNELTAKISCLDDGSATIPLSEWHSVNVTGVASGSTTSTPTMRQTPLTENALGAEQQPNVIPAPITSPSSPFSLPEEPSEDSSQGQVEDGGDGDDEGDSGGDGGDGDDEGDSGGDGGDGD
ncbi:MAG: hypothetical protein WAL42_12725, partial [Nitrososphaeraceae archaeon]